MIEEAKIHQYPFSSALQVLPMREKASSGLWLSCLIPIACLPGFYTTYKHCQSSSHFQSILALQVGVSTFHILPKLCHVTGKSSEVEWPLMKQKFALRVLGQPFLPAVLAAISLYFLADANPAVALVCSFLCHWVQTQLTQWLVINFASSFSLGEGLLVGQAASLVITLSAKGIFNLPKFYSEHQQISCFVQSAVLTSASLLFLIWRWHKIITMRVLIFLLLLFGSLGVGLSSLLLGEWSPLWLFYVSTTSTTRLSLLGWWANASIVTMVVTVAAQRYSEVPQTVMRKMYHFLLVLIFVPGVFLDPLFTHLASVAALLLFSIVELIRAVGVEPLSSFVSGAFLFFLDEKDRGALVLSHIYLLTGLASPLWLYPCPLLQLRETHVPDTSTTLSPFLVLLSGVLSVGVGDTMASIAGTYLGRLKWPGTKKTVEGSVFGVLSQVLFVAFLITVGTISPTFNDWPKLIVSFIICSFVEAFTDQVDNLVLPVLLFAVLMNV